MIKRTIIFLLMLLTSHLAPVFAQSTNTDKKTQQPEPESESRVKEKYTIFKPSEEISEDLSVPFPTDI